GIVAEGLAGRCVRLGGTCGSDGARAVGACSRFAHSAEARSREAWRVWARRLDEPADAHDARARRRCDARPRTLDRFAGVSKTMTLDRRTLIQAAAGAFAFGAAAPRFSFAATPGDRRLIVIILRGAMDGLASVPPHGDADYARVRGALAMTKGQGGIL